MITTAYYCTVEWHLRDFGKWPALIYGFAYKVSKTIRGKPGLFWCSGDAVSKHFGLKRPEAIYNGIADLVSLGFFEIKLKKVGKPTVYRVINHEDWAESHPDECAMRDLAKAQDVDISFLRHNGTVAEWRN